MTVGIKINQNGFIETVNYDNIDLRNNFTSILNNRSIGEMTVVDSWIGNGRFYLIYAWEVGYNNFNMFDFPYGNCYGDAFCLAIGRDEQIIDVDTADFDEHFRSIDIVNTDNEESFNSNDEYDYTDNFIVRDDVDVDDDGDMDIDYEDYFSDDSIS